MRFSALAFLGIIMATSGVVIAIPGITPPPPNMGATGNSTNLPPHVFNIPEKDRLQFCGKGTADSNTYVNEYSIPTPCTQPLAITSDSIGNIWFIQTNTGNIAKFDPRNQTFSEFENPSWPPNARSMMWGMDYSPDNSIWYSDDAHDSIWRFSIDDEQYARLNFPSNGNALPQRLVVDGSQILINDFLENKLTILDASAYAEEDPFISIPSPIAANSVTGGFVQDAESNIWYTNWIPEGGGGLLVKFAYGEYTLDSSSSSSNDSDDMDLIRNHTKSFQLPREIGSINGIVLDDSADNLWMVDTTGSYFYKFSINDQLFTKYITSPVPESAYGNHTGLIKSTPLSRPYWTGLTIDGKIIFNEQTANRIGTFDPQTEKLVEYSIPSKNPVWADCGLELDCGIAQSFDFTVVDQKIWFTEWVANNIGVIDTSVPLLVDVAVGADTVYYNDDEPLVILNMTSSTDIDVKLVINSASGGISVAIPSNFVDFRLLENETVNIPISIIVSDVLPAGKYKILFGAQTSDVTVSQFFNLVVG